MNRNSSNNFLTIAVLSLTLLLSYVSVFGQKKIEPIDKMVFVYYEQYVRNFIVIPNTGKLYSFKIYRKLKSEIEYTFMVELKKPLLPLRENSPTPWCVKWEDLEYHSRDIDYKVLAYDKKRRELCEMMVIWEEEPNKKKNESKVSSDTTINQR